MPRRHASKWVGSSPNPPKEFKKPNTSFQFSLHKHKRDTNSFDKHNNLPKTLLASMFLIQGK